MIKDINGKELKNGDTIVAVSEELNGKRHKLGHYVDEYGFPCEYPKGHFVANIQRIDLPKNFEILET